MSGNNSININDLNGIYRAMAKKANVYGGKTLEGEEISIFEDIKKTMSKDGRTFRAYNEFYDVQGKKTNGLARIKPEPAVSTFVDRTNSSNIEDELKNHRALKKAEVLDVKVQEKEKSKNRTKLVKKTINGKQVHFTFNQAKIEDYIINNAKDAKGKPIEYFRDIPEIRKKRPSDRTKNEVAKLTEFNAMMKSIINAGVEYGVNPTFITSIIQREVGFKGLGQNVTGANGKGYMQITSAPVKDFLGLAQDRRGRLFYSKNLKTKQYGPEMLKLLKSRGFNVECEPKDRGKVAKEIMAYLKENKDVDFNIRLGTLILRYYNNKANVNIKLAAQNYNGSDNKVAYGNAVKKYYNELTEKQKG